MYISSRFRKYLSYLEVQKSSKVDITKKEVFSESVIKTLYGSKFLVSETFSNQFIIVKLAGDQRFVLQETSLKDL